MSKAMPVTELTPDAGYHVLAWAALIEDDRGPVPEMGEHHWVVCWVDEKGVWRDSLCGYRRDVTHWVPCPEDPVVEHECLRCGTVIGYHVCPPGDA